MRFSRTIGRLEASSQKGLDPPWGELQKLLYDVGCLVTRHYPQPPRPPLLVRYGEVVNAAVRGALLPMTYCLRHRPGHDGLACVAEAGLALIVNPVVGKAVKTRQQFYAQSGLTIDMDVGKVTWVNTHSLSRKTKETSLSSRLIPKSPQIATRLSS